ncbi:MAG: hypothetical protein E6K81_11480 [Candidatus Eisenbacteria bacterium]|uniref:Endonuclease MutS2 n=1 Tax=Eiseniibacteriota bacterium TaxID=2212470 RepID=A0A538U4U7_UNCEI|nr:MAG: hypothetical protein E6K81_11480 [Candidatus Eisenbacteria bacterium]
MDEHSLRLLEFHRVTAAVAERATSETARAAIASARPLSVRAERDQECARLAEAIRRCGEPGEWCFTGTGELGAVLAGSGPEPAPLDGPALAAARARTTVPVMGVAAEVCSMGEGVVPGSGWLKDRFLAARRRAERLREGGSRAKAS